MSIIIKNKRAVLVPKLYIGRAGGASVYSTYNEVVALYPSIDKSISNIEGLVGVPVNTSLSVEITVATATSYLTETILVDRTSSATFWGDIRNWLYSQNLTDFQYINDKQAIDEPYIYILFKS